MTKLNCPKCGFEMKMGKKGNFWYCPTNLKDEFHKSFIPVEKEPQQEEKTEQELYSQNEKLDFQILLMEELGAIQESLEKIVGALKLKMVGEQKKDIGKKL